MRGIDGSIIIDLGDGVQTTLSGSLSSLAISTLDENDTIYNLYPIKINEPPIITAGILDASIPDIKPIQAAKTNRRIMYLNGDGTIRIAAGRNITLKVEATQPNTLNVENGIPKIIPPQQSLIYTWRKDSVILSSENNAVESKYIINDNILVIQDVTITDSGLYSCDITNDIGTTASEDVELEILDVEADPFFQINHVSNPIAANGLDGWTNSVGSIEAKKLSKIPSQTYKEVNNTDYFGYTVDMFNPRPYQLNYVDIKNYNPTDLLANGGYFTRTKLNYFQNGELVTISAYQDIDMTDIQEYIQNSVYGVKGVRGIFTCYIGNAISRFLHNSGYTTITARNRKKARLGSNYNLGQSRLSLENMLRAGLPEINETIEVVIEEYNGNNRIPTSILDLESDVARRVSRISLLDPWTKVKNSTNNNDLFGRINQMATKLYGSNEDTKYTMGQYVEHNKVIINQLNFNTTKIRIRLNFTSADIRLSDLDPTFTENTDEIFDLISWQKPYKRNTSPLTQEGDFIYFSLSQLPKNQGKPITKFVSKNGVSRGLITGLNLNLIPLLDEKRNDYYTYNIGSVISNTQTKVPSTLII